MSAISTIEFNLATLKTYNETIQAFEDTTLTGNLYTVEGVTNADGSLRQLSVAELVMVICLARAAEKEKAIIDLMKDMSNNTDALNALTDIEKELLAGKSLSAINGNWTYNGQTFTRADRLLGELGIVPIDGNKARNLDSLQSLATELETVSAFQAGFHYWNGSYRNAYGILWETGSLSGTYNGHTAEEAYSQAASLGGSRPLTEDEKTALRSFGVDDSVLDMTAEEASIALERLYYHGIVKSTLQQKIQNYSILDDTVNTDQLITDIESKMDSMNSFSQQKMIELQSETNKRDQAYDMITNILKSMNTVQVGIVNNI